MPDDLSQNEDAPSTPQPSSNGRSSEFQGGASGGGFGAHIASALPEVKQATPTFDPTGSVLAAANSWSGVGNGSSDNTLKVSDPYGLNMRNSIKQADDGKAE